MARSIRSGQLENRTSRLKLAIRRKVYAVRIAPGVRLGYRRTATGGTWNVLAADGKGGSWLKGFADADDHENANGDTILDFWQAQEQARVLARGEGGTDGPNETAPVTVQAALDDYEADLKTRNGDTDNAARIRPHMTDALRNKPVALLTARELRRWRDALAKKLAAGSVNRVATVFRALLNLAASTDTRITSTRPWDIGLQALRDAGESRNVILTDETIKKIIGAAYADSEQFGLLVEMAATTGARPIQLARLEVGDVQRDRTDPRLMMPSSRKGKGTKKITRRPVPIPDNLAIRLLNAGEKKPTTAPLLVKPSGEPWSKSDHSRLFERAIKKVVEQKAKKQHDRSKPIKIDGYLPSEVTIYALRHSNIVRQLLASVPIRVVASTHDTSVAMIEKTYAKYITDHSDALVRPSLFNLGEPTRADNVVPYSRKS